LFITIRGSEEDIFFNFTHGQVKVIFFLTSAPRGSDSLCPFPQRNDRRSEEAEKDGDLSNPAGMGDNFENKRFVCRIGTDCGDAN
jgi:hypothetical protein